MWRGPGPHVKWAGVVVKLSDGTTHAVEFSGGFITADVKLDSREPYASVWIQGPGHHWTEGEHMGPKVEQRELPPGRNVIEAG